MVVTVTAVYAYGVTRFRVPAEVALVVLAGCAIGAIGQKPGQAFGSEDSPSA